MEDGKNGSMADLNKICLELGLENRQIPEIWRKTWPEIQWQDAGHLQDRLDADYWLEMNDYLQLDASCLAALLQTLEIVKSNPNLLALLYLNHVLFFHAAWSQENRALVIPEPQKPLANLAGLFPALILFTGLPHMIAYYREHQISMEILRSTLSDVTIWMEDYERRNGRYGLSNYGWLMNHLNCRLFRLGRLQYILKQFSGAIKVYRHAASRKVCALSVSGINFRGDGQIDGTNSIFDRQSAWTSTLFEQENKVQGYPVRPLGYADKTPVVLPRDEWSEVLAAGAAVLDVHIPEDGRLDHQACGESMKQAVRFYRDKFPETKIEALVCTSWLLDPQLQLILDKNANIVKFQREVYLYPVLSDDRQIFERVFHTATPDVRQLNAASSLQKAILKHVKAGNRMHGAAMFLLADDVELWGSQPYQGGAV